MIKAIIVDDEIHSRESLVLLLKEHNCGVEVLELCSSARAGIDAIERYHPDLVFLDIEMPVMNGFDMLEKLREISFAIIFTTSYDQYAIKAVRFSALDYLLKPIDPKELIKAVERAAQLKVRPGAEQLQLLLAQLRNAEHGFRKVAVPTIEGFELIATDSIIRCEADNNYTHFILKNKGKIVACRTLKEIEEQLQGFSQFVRVHHSFIINLNEVVRYVRGEGGYLVMTDDATVSVSRSRKDALLKFF